MSEIRKSTSKENKLIYQLFVGKVSEVIGFEKTIELLKESKKQILKVKEK